MQSYQFFFLKHKLLNTALRLWTKFDLSNWTDNCTGKIKLKCSIRTMMTEMHARVQEGTQPKRAGQTIWEWDYSCSMQHWNIWTTILLVDRTGWPSFRIIARSQSEALISPRSGCVSLNSCAIACPSWRLKFSIALHTRTLHRR